MLRIHKEGTPYITVAVILVLISGVIAYLSSGSWVMIPVFVLALVLLFFFLQFFRNPSRPVKENMHTILSPADGKVVAIEEHFEDEFLKEKRLQISIFMSPVNVHYNTAPISGTLVYKREHPGKYLVAWHPKSSTENERCTLVVENKQVRLLFRQIAGAMARRIVNYAEIGQEVKQGDQIGFIKFGSRVDLMLPLESKILVRTGQKVRANLDIIAELVD